jgi:hypothetical protein
MNKLSRVIFLDPLFIYFILSLQGLFYMEIWIPTAIHVRRHLQTLSKWYYMYNNDFTWTKQNNNKYKNKLNIVILNKFIYFILSLQGLFYMEIWIPTAIHVRTHYVLLYYSTENRPDDIYINHLMMVTAKRKGWHKPNQYISHSSYIPMQTTNTYRINCEILTPYADAAGMLLLMTWTI